MISEEKAVLKLLLKKIESKNSWGKNELKELILNLLLEEHKESE